MGAVWMLARAHWRTRWRGLIVLMIVIAVAGGVVLAAFAGARRTRTAAERFRATTRSADVSVNIFPVSRRFAAEIGALPAVESSGQVSPWAVILGPADSHQFVSLVPAVDRRFGHTVDRSLLVSGRRAHGRHEMVASESFARAQHVLIGDTVVFHGFTPEQGAQLRDNSLVDSTPRGPTIRLRVVGIDRRAADFSPAASQVGLAFATHDVFRAYDGTVGDFGGLVRVRLRPGATRREFVRDVRHLAHGRYVDFDPTATDRAVDDTLNVLAMGLTIFGIIAAAGSLVAVLVLVARSVPSTGRDQQACYAMGLTSGGRTTAGLLPLLPIAALGALGAVGVAILGSPRLPIGLGRTIEAAPGLSVDGLVLGAGGLAVALVVIGAATVAAARAAHRRAWDPARAGRPLHSSRAARAAASVGSPPPVVVGIRMALERGRGRAAVPVRPALLGAIVGVAGIVAAGVVGASVGRLTSDPARYGWTFDRVVVGDGGQQGDRGPCGPQRSVLERDRDIASLGVVCVATVSVDGEPVAGYGYRTLRGTVARPIVRGRAPRGAHEVALGEKTLQRAGISIGDRIRIQGNHGSARVRVVGTAVFPSLEDPTPVAEGTLADPDLLARISVDSDSSYNHLVVRWRPGIQASRASHRLEQVSGQRPNRPSPPLEVDRLSQLHALPWFLAGFLALLAFVAVAHAVVTNTRRRRSEFALLATLGFLARQLRATVDTQAVTLVAVGLLAGVPLGLLTGRWAWEIVAGDLGLATDAAVPLAALVLLVPLVLVAALLLAAVPAWTVTRTRPAVALRAE